MPTYPLACGQPGDQRADEHLQPDGDVEGESRGSRLQGCSFKRRAGSWRVKKPDSPLILNLPHSSLAWSSVNCILSCTDSPETTPVLQRRDCRCLPSPFPIPFRSPDGAAVVAAAVSVARRARSCRCRFLRFAFDLASTHCQCQCDLPRQCQRALRESCGC